MGKRVLFFIPDCTQEFRSSICRSSWNYFVIIINAAQYGKESDGFSLKNFWL